MSIYYQDEHVTLHHGNCLDVIRSLPDDSIDSVCTDPPYGLEFMGKDWDAFKPSKARIRTRLDGRTNPTEGKSVTNTPESYTAGMSFQEWCTAWATECLRVLKPGGYMVAFGGSRTWHRLACAVEDAGFEIRDSIAWLYGSGFPKSLNIGEGRGTALKPAFEPIVVGRRPLGGTVAANVLAYGTGALNIDLCRTEGPGANEGRLRHGGGSATSASMGGGPLNPEVRSASPAGRWPTNVLLDDSQADVLDAQTGTLTSGQMRAGTVRAPRDGVVYGRLEGDATTRDTYGDSGGASRFFPTFHYEAKAPTAERPDVDGVRHPTVKPLDLMRWLVRLVTPPGGVVLEPFAGSGTTAEACVHEHMRCIAIEREADYLPLIVSRLTKPIEVGFDFGSAS